MKNILFLCVANAARSQMAEGLAKQIFGPGYTIQSAGSQPGSVHPMARQVLAEQGVDTQEHTSKSVQSIDLAEVDMVITLCAEEICPVVAGKLTRLHWPLQDPATPQANEAAQLETFREIRDQIQERLKQLKITLDLQDDRDFS